MPERAQVTSVEAIEAFRASLILFLSKARPTLEEVSGDVLRTKLWLQHDQRDYWEKQMKLRSRELERAQSELFSARISQLQVVNAAQELALHRAQRSVREAESKLRLLKKWDRELENRTDPLVKQVEQLHGFLTTEMVRANALLVEMVRTLEAYSQVAPSGGSGAQGLSGAANTADEAVKPADGPDAPPSYLGAPTPKP